MHFSTYVHKNTITFFLLQELSLKEQETLAGTFRIAGPWN